MTREFSFNLSIPLEDQELLAVILEEARRSFSQMRISRKPDRHGAARFYLSFPSSGARADLSFQEWFLTTSKDEWELSGPNHGRWGLI